MNNVEDHTNIIKALKISRFITITLHEFNHYIYSYILHSNNYKDILLNSPRKKEFKIGEGGILMELLLFGDEIDSISLEQALYILSEESYEKSEKQFQKEFINVSKSNFSLNSKYFNINNIPKEKNFNTLSKTYIKAKIKKKDNDSESVHKRRKYHCVLGRCLSLYGKND